MAVLDKLTIPVWWSCGWEPWRPPPLKHRTTRCCGSCRCSAIGARSRRRNTTRFASSRPGPAAAAAPARPASPPAPAPQGLAAADLPPLINKALANKWYEKIGLRGYTQFRFADVLSEDGPALEVPADRSVNANESFMSAAAGSSSAAIPPSTCRCTPRWTSTAPPAPPISRCRCATSTPTCGWTRPSCGACASASRRCPMAG